MVDAGRRGRRSDRRALQCAAGLGRVPAERHHLPGDGGLLLRLQRPPQQGGLHRPEFSLGHVLLGGATQARRARRDGAQRRHHPRQHRAPAGRHRRRDAAGAHLACHLPQRVYSGCRGHRREGPPRRRLRSARFLPGHRHAALRRAKAQRGFLYRRRPEVAVRRPRHGVSLRAARPGQDAGAHASPAGSATKIPSASRSAPPATRPTSTASPRARPTSRR